MKNIHLLPTTQDSWLCLKDGELVNANDGGCMLGYDPPRWITQHIYITNSEEIKDGDWFFNPFINEIQISCNPDGCKKIILTTDTDLIADGVQAIDDEFLEWFVNNPSCEFADVNDWLDDNGTIAFGGDKRYQLCNHLYNKQIIPKEENKKK